jgi:hypothetical protein
VLPQIGISSSSNPQDHPQDHMFLVGWIVAIWVLDMDLCTHAHDLLNLIQKSYLKSDLSDASSLICGTIRRTQVPACS